MSNPTSLAIPNGPAPWQIERRQLDELCGWDTEKLANHVVDLEKKVEDVKKENAKLLEIHRENGQIYKYNEQIHQQNQQFLQNIVSGLKTQNQQQKQEIERLQSLVTSHIRYAQPNTRRSTSAPAPRPVCP